VSHYTLTVRFYCPTLRGLAMARGQNYVCLPVHLSVRRILCDEINMHAILLEMSLPLVLYTVVITMISGDVTFNQKFLRKEPILSDYNL